MPRSLLPAFDSQRLIRFDAFAESLRPVFPRSDQFLRFRSYLRGLLESGQRKNVESLAAASLDGMNADAALAQALQHFVSQSPWDADKLLAEIRSRYTEVHADKNAVWVVQDGVFPKKGRHSVGVHRQFARLYGRKLNCQVAVVVSQVGPRGYFPLKARLYLPSHWLRENAETAEKMVPEQYRLPASKPEVALRLLDELRIETGKDLPIVAEEAYVNHHEFADGLQARSLKLQIEAGSYLESSQQRFEWMKAVLGLVHFEGRTWRGWHHHVGLVFAAYHFLAVERLGAELPPFCSVLNSTR